MTQRPPSWASSWASSTWASSWASSSSTMMAWSSRIVMRMRRKGRIPMYDDGMVSRASTYVNVVGGHHCDTTKGGSHRNSNRRSRNNANTRAFLRPSSSSSPSSWPWPSPSPWPWPLPPSSMFGTTRQCTVATTAWWPTVLPSSVSSSVSSSYESHQRDVTTTIRVRWQHSAAATTTTATATDTDADADDAPNSTNGGSDDDNVDVATATPSSSSAGNTDTPTSSTTTTTTCASTSTPTQSNLHDIWHRRTRRLLDRPVGTLEDESWNEALQILKYWFSNSNGKSNGNGNQNDGGNGGDDREGNNVTIIMDDGEHLEDVKRGVEKCFDILDRLSKEQEEEKTKLANDASTKQQSPRISTVEILNPILKLWRRAFKVEYAMRGSDTSGGSMSTATTSSSSTTTTTAATSSSNSSSRNTLLLPSAVAQRLKKYEDMNLIRADEATYTMILDTASRCTSSLPEEEGLLFADQYLQDWWEESHRGLHAIKPDLVAVGTVVHAWAESDRPFAAYMAESWVEQARDYIPLEEGMAADRSILYTTVMSAWAKAGDPAKAQYWMDQLQEEEHSPPPDITAWSTLLKALANADACEYPKAAMRAEAVLQKMQQLYRSGELDQPPNVFSYSLVMEAWNRRSRDNPESANRAHMWLQRMKTNGVAPNTVSYNTVISSHVRAGNLRQAERLLEEMMRRKDDEISPDIRTFSSLLAGLANVGTVQAAERAESLLEMMRNMGNVPTTRTYSSCISCWAHAAGKAKRGHKGGAVKRAQALFHKMKQVDKLDPDVYVYTSLLNAYGKGMQSRNAQKLLDAYLAEYKASGQEKLKPTVQTFSTVMSAWSQYHHPDAAENAHALLLQMEQDFEIEPNVYCYSAVLRAYANSPQLEEAVESAARLFAYLRSDATSVEPNRFCYNAMIRVLANAGRAEEAEQLLDEMLSTKSVSEESSSGQRIVRSKPNAYTFGSVLQAWSKSHDPNAGERAEQTIRRMQDLYRSQVIDEPPNMVCYTTVMTCWAHSLSPDGAQRAEDWLRMMQQGNVESINNNDSNDGKNHERLRPNRIAYNIVINGWANQGDLNRVDALMEELQEASRHDPKLTPDEYSYRAVWKAIQNSKLMNLSLEDRLTRMADLVRSMSEIGMSPTTSMQEDLARYSRELAEEAATIK